MTSIVRRGLRRIRRVFWRTPAERAHARWYSDPGADTRRHDYPLDAESVVLDVGGFEGGWAEQAIDRFGCTVHVFEPVPEFAAGIEARLRGRPAFVHRYGLAATTMETEFSIEGDGSSALRHRGKRQAVQLRSVGEVFEELGLARVDLMKINIEGAEYDLLDHMLDRDLIRRVRNLLVQFHEFVPGARRRMREIQARLTATHEPQWEYVFVWESWRRRASAPADPRIVRGA
jgi:FkbM family methyltransferase